MDLLKIDVIKFMQKGQILYLGYMSPEVAKLITFTDDYPPAKHKIGYQRPPEKKRVKDFSNYLQNEPASFVTPILLNSRSTLEFHEEGNGKGHILIPKKNCLAIVDGQHRTLGTIQVDNCDIPIPFMLFDNLNVAMEKELFITINKEQKKVSMSHVKFIGQENDLISQIVVRLEQDADSPWFKKVNLVGLKGTKRPVSLDSLSNATRELLQFGEIKMLNIEQQYILVRDFWEVVSKVWPDAWEAPKNSLLRKSMGTLAISKLGGYVLPQCLIKKDNCLELDKEKLTNLFMRASNVNWMNNGDFKGFSGRQGASLVKNALDSIIFIGDIENAD